MSRSRGWRSQSNSQSLTATVSLGGDHFDFQLYTRPLQLGQEVTIQYYWMDSSQFRTINRSPQFLQNYRSCVAHWWAAMQSCGPGSDLVQLTHLIRATSYLVFAANKSMQRVYRDAFMRDSSTDPESQSLSEDDRERIQAVVASQDRERVLRELDQALGRAFVPTEDALAYRQIADAIQSIGVELFLGRGLDGMHLFVNHLDSWSRNRRKKGGRNWLRTFLSFFAYECKVSFYLTYTNAWIGLIPWLREHRGLDQTSERFLRFWHMQNQPTERPDGTFVPDVFSGQVLSLHPFSGFFMKDSGLCAIAGRFFTSPSYEDANHTELPEYWDLIGAILTAANLYRQAYARQANTRGQHERNTSVGNECAGTAAEGSHAQMLEDYAIERNLRCGNCHGALQFVSYVPANDDDDFRVEYQCERCHRQTAHRLAGLQFREWLLRRD